VGDHGLLTPGSHRASAVVDDAAFVDAMVRVEVAWVRALAHVGAIEAASAAAIAEATTGLDLDLAALGAATEAAGNPVVPLVTRLREACGDQPAADLIHRGLTSQDVLDTALILLAREALLHVRDDLLSTAQTLSTLAEEHRHTVMAGRTLTQHATPITFGLKAARWLDGILDALATVESTTQELPAQCGGAAGTLALAGEVAGDPVGVARAFAAELALDWPGLPWHTNRAPITRIGGALVATCDAVGALASDVALLSRPEFGEVREGSVLGRGGSSTMPHKRNPVLSILVRSAALQAPFLGAQLHLAAGLALDERPDGAWHSEWPALRRLLEITATATSQAAELAAGLDVNTDAMAKRAAGASSDLLAERATLPDREAITDPAAYLGAADQFIDAVVARLDGRGVHGD
jgi:3-carboxy-cis,cis-muconate cycloisomerase